MRLAALLKEEAEITYGVTAGLFKLVDETKLDWKPATGSNWMTLGQLVMHCTNACGAAIKGFITNDWGLPEGVTFEDLPPEQALPPAEKLPTVDSIEQALKLLEEDKQLAFHHLDQLPEDSLPGERAPAPWGGPELTLFQHLLHMIEHQAQHKGQLYYYLKLLDRDVNTSHLWGI